MINKPVSNIRWMNIYYMLVYCIEELQELVIDDTLISDCKDYFELLVTLLSSAVDSILEDDFRLEYMRLENDLEHPKGRVDMQKSLTNSTRGTTTLTCGYNILNSDTIYYRYIKSVLNLAYEMSSEQPHIWKLNKNIASKIKEQLESLSDISVINLDDFDMTQMDTSDLPDYLVSGVTCARLVHDRLMITDNIESGKSLKDSMSLRFDRYDRLCYIFEKFVRNYTKREYTKSHDITVWQEYIRNEVVEVLEYEDIDEIDFNYTGEDDTEGEIEEIAMSEEVDDLDLDEFTIRERYRLPDILIRNNVSKEIIVVDLKWYEDYKDNYHNEDAMGKYVSIVADQFGLDQSKVRGRLIYASSGDTKSKLSYFKDGSKNLAYTTLNLDQSFENIKSDLNSILDNSIYANRKKFRGFGNRKKKR